MPNRKPRKPSAPACFADPRPIRAAVKGRLAFVAAYRAVDHRLNDGTPVTPTVKTALLVLKYLDEGWPWFPLVITEGSYETRPHPGQ